MQKKLILSTLLILTLSLLPVSHAHAAPRAEAENNQVAFDFPNSATFSADIKSDAQIASIMLEYGNNQQTCGEVVAKAYPEFSPSSPTRVSWTWDMRQSGSLPPGTTLWWRWRVTDANGVESISDTKTAVWLDNIHNWRTMDNGEHLRLHWYEGDDAFAAALAKAASNGLQFNETQSGLRAEEPIDLYIYANTSDMKDAILYEPSWTGGMAFPEENIVIIGISQADLEWGQKAIVHELTHVLVGHLTFSCLGDVPTWLNEGLAVYSEGKLDPQSQNQLDQAIRRNELLSVRSLSAGFSEVADRAYLSYSESYSLVKFLIEAHGQDKMSALLAALRDGKTTDEALMEVYGFDADGLEDVWRKAVGAGPRPASAKPTAPAAPTLVPTYIPFSGASLSITPTPYVIPTSTFDAPSLPPGRPPLSLTLLLLGTCCLMLLVAGIFILGFIVQRGNRKAGKNE